MGLGSYMLSVWWEIPGKSDCISWHHPPPPKWQDPRSRTGPELGVRNQAENMELMKLQAQYWLAWVPTVTWHRGSPPCTSAGGHRTLRWAETSWGQDWVILTLTSSPKPSQCQQWVRGCFSGGSLSPSEKNVQPCLGECVCVCVCVLRQAPTD